MAGGLTLPGSKVATLSQEVMAEAKATVFAAEDRATKAENQLQVAQEQIEALQA